MSRVIIRQFSQTGIHLRPGYSTVHPVHHLVKVKKANLKPGLSELLIPNDDITSVKYRPTEIDQDRLYEHYRHTLKPDLMLNLYKHDSETIPANTKQSWGVDSPYKLYRPLKKPLGSIRTRASIKPVTDRNIPEITGVTVHSFNKKALVEPWLDITTRLQVATITNVKPKQLFAKTNLVQWKLRKGKPVGGKVDLVGRDMNQFLTTLVELVLPRIRTFKGIKSTSGDKKGNITFGLDNEDIQFFPEIEAFQDLYPNMNGLHVTIKTSASNDEEARTLLSAYGFPFT
ncbi:54S ribosomal protein L7 mitochondrial [Spathaspora sp. JA1]|nr:54S ribosomal protein L7 mitochondrial [Spathaspora sp. JA1]